MTDRWEEMTREAAEGVREATWVQTQGRYEGAVGGHMRVLPKGFNESVATIILALIRRVAQEQMERDCRAVCEYCREGKEHKELYPVYCRAEPIRRAFSEGSDAE